MKFSVWPSNGRSWEETRSLAQRAEAQGWYGLWCADHLMPNTEDGEPADGDALECWSILAGLASVTERIRLGSLVSPVTLHHPVVLAKRAITVDHISNGRAVLGIGAGWQVNEHRAAGVELPAPGERVTRFGEAIEIIARMRTEQRVTTTGSWFTATNLPADPKPVAQPMPLMVGTASPRMARAAARWADEWNTWGDVALVETRTHIFHQACDAVGRDPTTVRRSAQAMVFFADDSARAAKIVEGGDDRVIAGSSEHIVEQMGRYAELGVGEFIMPDFNFSASESQRAEAFDRFWTEVATQL
jgi:alkanesulfonate monooxygenase SsuD/methylene tetrahydromethanopterin reductase-like flavin-dependent oxidoreductase (luciferase family)